MNKPQLTIDDLLHSLRNPNKEEEKDGKKLSNTADTWSRIGSRDSFSELGFSTKSDLDDFLKEWVADNPYNNI